MRSEIAEIAMLSEQIAATRHVGRSNRLTARRHRLLDAIDAGPDRLILLRTLLDHPQQEVRMAAAWRCVWGQILLEDAERVVPRLVV